MTEQGSPGDTGGVSINDPKPGAAETFGKVLADELADIRTRSLAAAPATTSADTWRMYT